MAIHRPKGDKGAADRLFSEIVRSVGYCESCFKRPPTVQLQCAHIISRRYSNTRVDLRNAMSLCAGCHRRYTDHPIEFSKFVQRSWASQFYDDMYVKSQSAGKVDWEEMKRHLLQLKQDLNGGSYSLDQLRDMEYTYYK